MHDQPVMRIFRYRPLRGAFDEILRDVMLPDLARRTGVRALYAGRQGPDDIGARVVVSIWIDEADMVSSMGPDIEMSAFHPEYLAETTDRVVEVVPLQLELLFAAAPATGILRFARGRVEEGQMAAYVESVSVGTRRDVTSGCGPVALYVGLPTEGTFVTLSVWRSWTDIQVATGADLSQPVATQRAERLLEFQADHYEFISESEDRRSESGDRPLATGDPLT